VTLFRATVFALALMTAQSFAQDPSSTATPTQPESALGSNDPANNLSSKEARGPICQDADDVFAGHFDYDLVACAVSFTLVLPLALPWLGVRRWWWLAHPYKRWIYLTAGGLFLCAAFIYGPALAITLGWLPAKYALLPLKAVNPLYPSGCGDVSISTAGFLWGQIGSGRELSILAIPKMALAGTICFSLSTLVYWIVFWLMRRLRPLQAVR
jgi:hypothetical protein